MRTTTAASRSSGSCPRTVDTASSPPAEPTRAITWSAASELASPAVMRRRYSVRAPPRAHRRGLAGCGNGRLYGPRDASVSSGRQYFPHMSPRRQAGVVFPPPSDGWVTECDERPERALNGRVMRLTSPRVSAHIQRLVSTMPPPRGRCRMPVTPHGRDAPERRTSVNGLAPRSAFAAGSACGVAFTCANRRGEEMERLDKIRLSRRDMLKLSAGGAGMFAIGAGGFAVPGGIAKGGGGGGGGSVYIEAFPTSPLITSPFNDPLVIPPAMQPSDPPTWDSLGGAPDPKKQDSLGPSPNNDYYNKYGRVLGTHQFWPGDGMTGAYKWLSRTPSVYQIKLKVAGHKFTSSSVQPIDSFGRNSSPPGSGNSNV